MGKWLLKIVLLSKRKVLIGEPYSERRQREQIVLKEITIPKGESEIEEVVIPMTEPSNKISKLISNNKVINNPIHGRHWQKTIKNPFQNIDNY